MRKEYILALLFLGFLGLGSLPAQNGDYSHYSCGTPDDEEDSNTFLGGGDIPFNVDTAAPCSRNKPRNANDGELFLSRFIPDATTPLLTLRVNLNIWNLDDDTGNFWEDSPLYRDTIRQLFDEINKFFAFNVTSELLT